MSHTASHIAPSALSTGDTPARTANSHQIETCMPRLQKASQLFAWVATGLGVLGIVERLDTHQLFSPYWQPEHLVPELFILLGLSILTSVASKPIVWLASTALSVSAISLCVFEFFQLLAKAEQTIGSLTYNMLLVGHGASTFATSLLALGTLSAAAASTLALLLNRRWVFSWDVAGYLSTLASFGAGIEILSFAYGNTLTHQMPAIPTTSLPTAIGSGLLAATLITANGPAHVPLRCFVGQSHRTRLLRAFTIVILLALATHSLIFRALLTFLPSDYSVLGMLTAVLFTLILAAAILPTATSLGTKIDQVEAAQESMHTTLRTSETTLRMLTEQMPVLLWTTDQQLRVTSITGKPNTGLTQIDSLVGRNITELLNENSSANILAAYARALKGETAAGELRLGDRYIDFRVAPLRNSAGEIMGCLCVGIDVTERKKTETDLAATQATLQHLVSVGPAIIYSAEVSPHRSMTYVSDNIADRLGYTATEACTDPLFWIDHLHPEDKSRALEEMSKAISQSSGTMRYRFRLKDGRYVWLQDELKVIHDLQGNPIELVGYIIDITTQEQVEAQLRYSEERYRMLVENVNEVILAMDLTGRLTYVSPVVERQLGYTPDELIGHPFTDFVHPDDLPRAFETLAQAQPRCANILEIRVLDKTSAIHYLRASARVIMDGDKAVGIIGVVADTTAQRQANEALRASAHYWQSTFDAINDPICVLTLDGIIQRCNLAFTQLVKHSEARLVGHHCSELLNCLSTQPCPLSRMRQSLHREEEWLQVEDRWFNVVVDPVFNEHGLPIGAVHMMTDVTEIVRLNNALHISEERYRRLFNAGTDAILVCEIQADGTPGHFLEVNDQACALLGYTREEMLQMALFDIFVENTDEVRTWLRRVLTEKRALFEGTSVAKSGAHIPFEVSADLFEYNGRPTMLAIARDIRERKRLEEQFLQSQKMEIVGRLAGGVAHDFNNLLTVINGYAALVRRSLSPNSEQAKDLDQVLKAGQRASQLTHRLLTFSRRQIMNFQVINPNDLITDLEMILRRLIGEQIDYVTILDSQLGLVQADPGQIEQVLTNLVVNARDAIPQDGRITIETENVTLNDNKAKLLGLEPGEFVCISVTDTGIGMTEEIRTHIFEPFFTTKEPGKGTGLGLSTVYGIVKQHRGGIEVQSKPNQGTRMSIYLPRVREREPQKESAQIEPNLPRGHETILVVEDEPMVRQLAVRALDALGYHVLQATDGADAVRLIEASRETLDLLVTDVAMPHINGRELWERLRERWPALPVVFMSGYADQAVLPYHVSSATWSFLAKPFTSDVLARKVRQLLNAQKTKPEDQL